MLRDLAICRNPASNRLPKEMVRPKPAVLPNFKQTLAPKAKAFLKRKRKTGRI
jgi:hypothetical protein